MSRIGDADLVRVRSHEELRAGMTVVIRPCLCGKAHSLLLLENQRATGPHFSGSPCPVTDAWVTAPCFHEQGRYCFCAAIPSGRLYRLRDLDSDEEEGRRIACDIDDRRRAAVGTGMRFRRLKSFGGPADGE